MKLHPTIEYLKECLKYDEGKVYWLKRPIEHFKNEGTFKSWNSQWALLEAGSIYKFTGASCWCISINKIHIPRSRIVWAIHNNEWRIGLDHEDRNPFNDKIENLRIATQQQNTWNQSIKSNNTSRYKGVSWYKAGQQWEAYINISGKKKHLGYFDTVEEAAEARRKAAIIYHGEFATDGT